VDFLETLLPGVGVRYDATTASGAPLAIVVSRDGAAELLAYRTDDPDAVAHRVELTADEAGAVGELLGAPRVTARLADLTREVPGLLSARVEITPGSRYDGRRLGDSKARTRTGCSVVAIVSGDQVRTAPGPLARLQAGDVVVAIGSRAGLAEFAHLLAMSPEDDPLPVPEPTDDE
jgi:TrkA domain protein